ncbi:protein ATP6V1FNB isoform X3 [Epinephelus fuscoguttatus]|uniref:protein ATP6V1FNB isoform X3 n=1 Tax=Epinephelus fuscoguttatus TaxID=293821 RepID=UPI0020CFE927|nr:protein ATP6V1FNB isoform X3 [Epinephelus fuscoguttatus]
MRCLLTTQSQNFYREQIQKEMLTRLAWKSHYAKLYPSRYNPRNNSTEPTQLPQLAADPRAVLPPVTRTTEKRSNLPPSRSHPPPHPPPPPPPVVSSEGEGQLSVAPLMRPVSPETRHTLYQDSSHNGKGRSLYLQRRRHIRPEEKFDFPVLSSWEYGWRLGDYSLDYRTPSCAKSSVVKNTFYARNGVFSSPSAIDTLG